jgi:hypothetical protein
VDSVSLHPKKNKGKAVPVTGHRGPYDCETSRRSHFLDNRLTDGGEVVSLTCRPLFIPKEDSWYSFLLEAESAAAMIKKIEKIQLRPLDSNSRPSSL